MDEEMEDANGVPLIGVNAQDKLVVGAEGQAILQALPGDRDCNLIFVFGNARSGKSFMLNCLTGVPGLFQVINSATPCTQGVDLSSRICSLEWLEQQDSRGEAASTTAASDTTPQVGFVDVEGQGDKDSTYDTMLALPLLLASKVVLFNHKGAPTVHDMLSKLGVLARAAEYIELADDDAGDDVGGDDHDDDGGGDDDDDDDGGGGGGGEKNKKKKKRKFGHLHVMFRDFSFAATREEVYDQLLGKEKVKKSKMLKATGAKGGGEGGVMDGRAAAKERNDIRQMLLKNFSSIDVWLFKQPASAADLKAHKELPLNLVSPAFMEQVCALRASVISQMRTPRRFNGHTLTGPRLAGVVSQVVGALNDGGAINVPSLYRSMEHESVQRVCADVIATFNAFMKKARGNLPISGATMRECAGAMKTMKQTFEKELKDCSLTTEKEAKIEEIMAVGDKTMTSLDRDNNDAIIARVREQLNVHSTKVRDDFDAYCRDVMPVRDDSELHDKFESLKARAQSALKASLSGGIGFEEHDDYDRYAQESEDGLRDFFDLKSTENATMLKDAEINALRDEAIAAQEKLIAQNKQLEAILNEKRASTAMQSQLADLQKKKADDERRTEDQRQRMLKQQAEAAAIRKRKLFSCVIL
jgi:hypothetical protein